MEGRGAVSISEVTQATACSVILQTVRLKVKNREIPPVSVRCLLDAGSQRTFVTDAVCKELNLPLLGFEEIQIFAFGEKTPKKEKIKRVGLTLQNERDERNKIEIEALVTPVISGTCIWVPDTNVKDMCARKGISLSDKSNGGSKNEISLLIGSDYYWKVVSGNIRRLSNSLVASETLFGWTVNGVSVGSPSSSVVQTNVSVMNCDVGKVLRKFWELESLGIVPEKEHDEVNNMVLEEFNDTIKFENDRYEVKLPWNEKVEELKDNYGVAFNRIKNLISKFKKNSDVHDRYREVIEGHIDKGIAEGIDEVQSQRLYYLPHQAVIREDKTTTKFRVVFDASSHAKNCISLNDCLHAGPNLNPELLGLLIQFRQNRIAFTADIEQAFLQISLSEEDRDAVRFLWIDNSISKEDQFAVKPMRMRRVIFGANCSPFLLAATIKNHIAKFKQEFQKTFHLLDEHLYVDDLISGDDDEKEVLRYHQEVKSIMDKASFNMRKWITNAPALQDIFDREGSGETKKLREVKVLGYKWNIEKDILKFECHSLLTNLAKNGVHNTKREVLRGIGMLYDPIGFLNPFTVTARILMQEIWKSGMDWDSTLTADLQRQWKEWCDELKFIDSLEIPRHCFNENHRCDIKDLQLHCFTDASQKAYGTVIYLRFISDGETTTSFVMSKTRVTPLKKLSLPRLELMAAVLGSRVTKYVLKQLGDNNRVQVFCWTDSTVTLYWIEGDPEKWKPFVKNRVTEIQQNTDPASWRHCPGEKNPADQLTRGMTAKAMMNSGVWWKGPTFLTEADIPSKETLTVQPEVYASEMKNVLKTRIRESNGTNISLIVQSSFIEDILGVSNNFTKVIRVLCYISRFCHNSRHREKRVGHLSSAEMNDAEHFLIREIQRQTFRAELKSIRRGVHVPGDSKLKSLNPFLDEKSMLRVGGRLKNAPVGYTQKHPAILPANHILTRKIVESIHVKYFHVGVQSLLCYVRQRYWPINGKILCKRIVYNCVTCVKAKPIPARQVMGDLPRERVNPNCVFNNTGVDFCGPFYIKYKNQRKGVYSKIYVAIFICFVTRAIHLELVSDLTSESFIATLKRFFSRRGKSARLFTDNATNFVGANFELKRLYNIVKHPDENMAGYLASEGIEWKFIPPKTPNFGGVWEAGVKSFKHHLKRVVRDSKLSYEEFLTITSQIECILNSRPIAPISADIEDFEALTPGHFLIGRPLNAIAEPELLNRADNRLSRWQRITKMVQSIWKQWKRDYLHSLQQRSKWMFENNNIKLGSLVLIKEDHLPSCKWLLGRIVESFPGSDNKVRVVNVKTKNGIFRRGITKICILPIDS